VSSWERIASKNLQTLKLDRVRTKILAFSVLATLIPSVTTVWLAYSQGKRALTQTIATELVGVSSQAANELGLGLKERLYDLRIFSNSYEVTENLVQLAASGGSKTRTGTGRLTNYLNSVRERTADYHELVVFDLGGHPVASSPAQSMTGATLPEGWETKLKAGEPILGTPSWDTTSRTMTVMIAVPIQPAGSRAIGAFAGRLDLRTAAATLQRLARGHAGTAYLVSYSGDLILSSKPDGGMPLQGRLDGSAVRWLNTESPGVVEYKNPEGVAVIGTLRTVGGSSWGVLIELTQEEGFGLVNRFRNLMVLVLTCLFAVVGLLAYLLGLMLVRPLDRLSEGAARVAAGDFEVQLPVVTGGELGYLTTVFNDMVAKLRKSMLEVDAVTERLREKNVQLERLSLTDPLTGLFNRRQLMTVLENELKRAARGGHEFAILMIDVDHFKSYNDAFGHQAGDDALVRVADILSRSLREVDGAARYGGEEFVALLPETGMEQAAEVAERICETVRREAFEGEQITLSIGVASYPSHGASLESVIGSADGALYQAKRRGRDCVVRADWSQSSQPAALARR
jgi:diguanylate cyclase (GGDEF)-like protein